MRQLATFLVCSFILLSACQQAPQDDQTAKTNTISERLPIQDRDILLEPLERSMDDLVENIKKDPTFFHSNRKVEKEGMTAKSEFKLNGSDTVMYKVELSDSNNREVHEWYFNKKGHLIISQHEIINRNVGVLDEIRAEAYKFYYEDDGSLLSSYGRFSASEELPNEWKTVEITDDQEMLYKQRVREARKLLSDSLVAN